MPRHPPRGRTSSSRISASAGARVLMEHVTFSIQRGTTFAILGGSGCGKSTLLRYLIGLERPQGGRIEIDGVGEPHAYEGVPPFGVLFQSGALFSSLTLAENLALPLTTWTIAARTHRQRSRPGQAGSRRPRRVRGTPSRRDLGRHEEACRHRARDDAGARPAVLRRALRRPRPDLGGRTGSADRHCSAAISGLRSSWSPTSSPASSWSPMPASCWTGPPGHRRQRRPPPAP